MDKKISIASIGSISPLGYTLEAIWEQYRLEHHFIREIDFEIFKALCAPLPQKAKEEIAALKAANPLYKNLDPSVLYAILAARICLQNSKWDTSDSFGVNIGSSRGATSLFEKYHHQFLDTQKSTSRSSPTTTLGNISSWVSNDLQNDGPTISHSITCSTALHGLLNGVAWIKAGMATKFLVGGSEAPLTPFTVAQMKALRIYAANQADFPCQSLNFSKKNNTMVLGEGASVACLETGIQENTLAVIEGIGYGSELLTHGVSISPDAKCFQKSMKMALGTLDPSEVDVIVMHAPGTIKGDLAELRAIEAVFPNKQPLLTSNKWKIGHTFAASGMLSVEMAILMLKHNAMISVPFVPQSYQNTPIERVLINAVGFGGNAVSVLLTAPALFH